jgi:hypothetical protein
VLRRLPDQGRSNAKRDKNMFIEACGLVLNKAKQTLLVKDEEVELSSTD